MRVFITGASGFIGSFVAEKLLSKGHEICALMKPESDPWRLSNILGQLEIIYGSILDIDDFSLALGDWKPDTIIHLAWSGVTNEHRNNIEQIANINANAALALLAAEMNVRRFIGLGSQAEYGPHNVPLNEDSEFNPSTIYGGAKLASYQICNRICLLNGVDFSWVRVFSTYGPKDNASWLIPYLINQLDSGASPKLTLCEQKWDYLYVEDAAEAVVAIAEKEKAAGAGAVNLGSGSAVPLRRIVKKVRDIVSPNTKLGFGEKPYRPDQVMFLEADIKKIKRLTGWTPSTSLDHGLMKTVKWFRNVEAG